MAWRRRRGAEAVAADQLVRLRALLAHAVETIDAHRGWYGADAAGRIAALDDLQELRLVTKDDYRQTTEDRYRWLPPGTPHHIVRTSGSSGEPFGVAWTPWASWRNRTQRLWMLREMGVPLFGTFVNISLPRRARDHVEAGWRGRWQRRRLELSEAEPVEVLADRIATARPAWVTAQPHVLLEVGEALGGRWRPHAVSSHGSSTDDSMRDALTAAWGSVPLDIYGTGEHGQVLWQCRARDLYHVNHELAIVEVVDADGRHLPAGELGRLAITNLINPLQPFIRYANGDAAVMADRPCACGHALPALSRIEGRSFDWIVSRDGRRVPPQRLWASTAVPGVGLAEVRRYRVTQAPDRSVLVEVVPGEAFADDISTRWRAGYEDALGAGLPIEIRTVERIEVAPGERFRQFRSTATPG